MPTTMELLATLPDRPSPDQIRALFDRYRALMTVGDVDGICALFAEDATWEEPVGTFVEHGREAIRARYKAALDGAGGRIAMVADGEPRIAGAHAIALSIATVEFDGVPTRVETANAIVCNEAGEITDMKIYFGPSSIKSA